jgi:hypothetical protein
MGRTQRDEKRIQNLVRKSEKTRPLGRPGNAWESKIKN